MTKNQGLSVTRGKSEKVDLNYSRRNSGQMARAVKPWNASPRGCDMGRCLGKPSKVPNLSPETLASE